MSPFLKNGDVVTVSPCSVPPSIGHVVAFLHPRRGSLTIHRVIGRKKDSYLIRGDNTLEPDGYIQKKGILGIVTQVERDGKRVLLGQGPERTLIALLNREGLLFPFLLPVWKSVRPFIHWTKNRKHLLRTKKLM
jgi:hypothetical protein